MVTDDKKFKRLVRERARETGTNYTSARSQFRPGHEGASTGRMSDEDARLVADGFALIENAVRAGFFGDDSLVRLIATAAVGGVAVLCTDPPGTGHTALAKSVATAVGANVVALNGSPDVLEADVPAADPSDVLLVNAIDHIPLRAQRAVLDAGRQCVIVLAKRHPVVERVPHPLNDEILDRFAIGTSLGSPGTDHELDIIAASRGEVAVEERGGVTLDELAVLRRLIGHVALPDDVRSQVGEVLATVRSHAAVAGGAHVTAALHLAALAPIVAAANGRVSVTFDDVAWLMPNVLPHRLIVEEGTDVDALVQSALDAVAR